MSNPDDAYKTGYARRARAIVDAARAAALEDAAKECDREAKNWPTIGLPAENCARAIRALITKEITDAE